MVPENKNKKLVNFGQLKKKKNCGGILSIFFENIFYW